MTATQNAVSTVSTIKTFGIPVLPDRASAIGVLQAAVAAGVDYIDTAQYYGPGVVNDVIREALHPYPGGLAIVSKVAVRRDDSGVSFCWTWTSNQVSFVAAKRSPSRPAGRRAVSPPSTASAPGPATGGRARARRPARLRSRSALPGR